MYEGGLIPPNHIVDSWSKCRQLCADNIKCKVWTWVQAPTSHVQAPTSPTSHGTCYRRDSVDTYVINTNKPGHLSGTRECDDMTNVNVTKGNVFVP